MSSPDSDALARCVAVVEEQERFALAQKEFFGMAGWTTQPTVWPHEGDLAALRAALAERDSLRTRLAAAERCVAVMRTILPDHHGWCAIDGCDCGLDDARAALTAFDAAKGGE